MFLTFRQRNYSLPIYSIDVDLEGCISILIVHSEYRTQVDHNSRVDRSTLAHNEGSIGATTDTCYLEQLLVVYVI